MFCKYMSPLLLHTQTFFKGIKLFQTKFFKTYQLPFAVVKKHLFKGKLLP